MYISPFRDSRLGFSVLLSPMFTDFYDIKINTYNNIVDITVYHVIIRNKVKLRVVVIELFVVTHLH